MLTKKEPKPRKERLDTLLVERGLFPSREKAKAHILAGEILVNGQRCTSAGAKVRADADLRALAGDKYVSRGGEKLAGALDAFKLDVAGLAALDAGASTGGFTDCLLQRGVAHVTALDVGYGQLAIKLRNDPRVTVMERTNARHIEPKDFPRKFGLITIDVSFISLEKVLPALLPLLDSTGIILALVKPQFEAGPEKVQRGGVVKNPETHLEALLNVADASRALGLTPSAAAPSPITGPAGNIEFFMLLCLPPQPGNIEKQITPEELEEVVARAHKTFEK